jgi:carbonic anhydrase
VNVSVSTVMCDAWARGQDVRVHGWAFGVHDGLLQDLQMTVPGPDELDTLYRKAIDRVWDLWNSPQYRAMHVSPAP